jgi:hypothetical protein
MADVNAARAQITQGALKYARTALLSRIFTNGA